MKGLGVLRLRDATRFRARHHYAQDDNCKKKQRVRGLRVPLLG
jgi:hypothetical protein